MKMLENTELELNNSVLFQIKNKISFSIKKLIINFN